MPLEYWYPESIAGHDLPASCDAWALGAGTDKNSALIDGATRSAAPTPDDATTRIQSGTNSNRQAINIDWPRPVGSINATFNANFRRAVSDGGGGADASTTKFAFVNAGGTLGGDIQSLGPTFAYTTYGPQDVSAGATYRPGGGAWVGSDFDPAVTFAHFVVTGLVNDTVIVSTVWGQLDYNPPAGGFAFLLGIAGLLPVLGSLTDFSHLTRYLAWRRRFHPRHTILTGPDVEQAWREIRAYRHPRFFFPVSA